MIDCCSNTDYRSITMIFPSAARFATSSPRFSKPLKFLISVCIFFSVYVVSSQAIAAVAKRNLDRLNFSTIQSKALDGIGGLLDITQDADGFLWFAGETGLVRYDGYEFKRYSLRKRQLDGRRYNIVTSLHIDQTGRLWAGTSDGLKRFNQVLDVFEPVLNAKAQKGSFVVETIYESDTGDIWVATGSGDIFTYNERLNYLEKVEFNIPWLDDNKPKNIFSILINERGDLWFGSTQGLFRVNLTTEEIAVYYSKPGDNSSLSDNYVRTLYLDKQGRLWVGTKNGLNRFDYKTDNFVRFKASKDSKTTLAGNIVRELVEDKKGRLWVATDGGGLSRYVESLDQFESFLSGSQNTARLKNDKVRTVFIDRAGSIWTGHYPNGVSVSHLASQYFEIIGSDSKKQSLTSSDILSLLETQDGRVWIGTELGLNCYDPNSGVIQRYRYEPDQTDGLPASPVISLFGLDDAHLLLGTWGGGLSRLELDGHRFETLGENTLGESPNAILVDKSKRLWLAYNEGVLRYDNVNTVSKPEILGTKTTHSLFEASDGTIWAGEGGRLVRFRPEGDAKVYFFEWDKSEAERGNGVMAMVEDAQLNLWLATKFGLVKFDPKTEAYKVFQKADGLPIAANTCVVEQDDRYLWIATHQGISRFDRESQSFFNLSSVNGLAGDMHQRRSCEMLHDGRLAFGSTEGLTLFDPQQIVFEQPVFDFHLSSFKVLSEKEERPITRGTSIKFKLPNKANDIEFKFSAFNFSSIKQTLFRYKLEGYHEDWQALGQNNKVTLTNLPVGEYRLDISAKTSSTDWSDEKQLFELIISPPWWMRWWSFCLYVLLLVAGVVYFRKIVGEKRAYELAYRVAEAEKSEKEKDLQKLTANIPMIEHAMTHEKIYLDPNLTIGLLAEKLGVNERDVSQTINKHMDTNFIELLNRYRVEEAKRLLLEDKKKSVTHVMLESGFNSKATFYRAFKADCGLTPSQFRTQA